MKQKTIGIDARLMYQTGVGVYVRNLISNLATLDTPGLHFRIYARKGDIAKLRLRDTKMYRVAKFTFVRCDVGWHSFAEQLFFLWQLWKDNLDLVHFPYFSWPVLYTRPFIATVHDTILLTHATGKASTRAYWVYRIKHKIFRFVFFEQVKRAVRIIVPSEAVRNEIRVYFPHTKDKIQVIPEGVDDEFLTVKLTPVKGFEDERYFLYVGNCYPHKCVETLLAAFQKLALDDEKLKLCIVGPDNYFSSHLKKSVEKVKSIRFLHQVPTSNLKWLYSNAKALVLPSLSEGFGLPIVEAIACKCPLILSDIPVFREVAGDNVLYFPPTNVEELSARMAEILEGKTKEAKLDPTYTFTYMVKKIISIYVDN